MSATPSLVQPRLVVLDTAHFSGLVNDAISSQRDRRKAAQRFLHLLSERGWIPLLCFHHLEELMQHKDDKLVDARLAYLRELPLAAWVKGDHHLDLPGSIIELQAAEVVQALESPDSTLLEVRDRARDAVIAFGAGAEAIPDMGEDWRILRQALTVRQAQSQKVAAMSRWRPADIDETRIGDWLAGEVLPRGVANKNIERQLDNLTREVATRGDRRITSPGAVASEFMWEVVKDFDAIDLDENRSPALQFLLASGLEMEDIDPEETFGSLMHRLTFFKQLRIVGEKAGLPWRVVKAGAKLERLPVALIQDAMRRYAQDQPERKGSMLTDVHLLCLAAYAELTFVDKRTLNDLSQAARKVPALNGLLGRVHRAAQYPQVLEYAT